MSPAILINKGYCSYQAICHHSCPQLYTLRVEKNRILTLDSKGASVQFSLVQLLTRVSLWDPVNCSMPGFPVHHQLPELPQTHVHQVGDAIQPSHPLSSPSSLYIYTVEYYSAIEKNEIRPFGATWIELEIIILSKVSQKEKDKYHTISLICGF